VNPRITLALVLLCVIVLGATVVVGREREAETDKAPSASRYEGALLPRGVRAPNFSLTDQDGRRVSMRALRGRPVLVTFLYTTCEETCPGMAQTVRGALDDLGRDVPALAIAVDPPRDTPGRARRFLAKQRATGRLAFVLGSRDELRPVWKGFAIQPQSVRQEHQARFTLVDRQGFQRIGFPGSEATPERLAHDLRLLDRE
jgi:protein SCO1